MDKRNKIYRHLSSAKQHLGKKPNKAIEHASFVYAMIDDNEHVLMREVLLILIRGNSEMGNYQCSLKIIERLVLVSDTQKNDPVTWMGIFHERGIIYRAMNQYEFAIEEFFKALSIAEERKDIDARIRIINEMGILHSEVDNNKGAISSMMEALALVIEYKREKESINILLNLASVYIKMGRMKRALEKLERVETLLDFESESYRMGLFYFIYGSYHYASNNYSESEAYYHQSIKALDEAECDYWKIHVNNALVLIHEDHNQYQKAYDINRVNIVLAEKNNYGHHLEKLYLKSVGFARKLNKTEEAFYYFDRFQVSHKRNDDIHMARLKIGIDNLYSLRQVKKDKEIVKQENSQLLRLMQSLDTMINRLKTVQDFSYSMSSTLKIDDIVNRVYENLNDIMDAYSFAIYLYDDKEDVINYTYLIENGNELIVSRDPASYKNSFVGYCIDHRDVIVAQNPFELEQFMSREGITPQVIAGDKMHSMVFVPMIIENRIIGVMTIQSLVDNAYLEEDVAIIKTLAGFMATASHNASQAYELEQTVNKLNVMSYIDSLTSLYNRHALNERSKDSINDSDYKWYAGMMLDLDNFKGINDTYGHLIGDSTLRAVSRFINEETEELEARAYRYGGDEFFIELHVNDITLVEETAKRIIRNIENIGFEGECKVTASVGVEIINAQNHDLILEKIMSDADDLLYEAKDKGKNQVVISIKE